MKACYGMTLLILLSCNNGAKKNYNNWKVYGGNPENNHYSALTQIDTNNVTQLQVAWTYHCGDADTLTQIQVNPIIIDSTMYVVSPKLKLIALHASTGTVKWIFNPVDTSNDKFST